MTNLRFREDGSFRVLQMADIQDGPNVLPDTIRLIREAIRKADPDLVVFTGDQIRGYDPAYIDTFLRRPQVFAVLSGAMSLGFMAVIRSLVKKR